MRQIILETTFLAFYIIRDIDSKRDAILDVQFTLAYLYFVQVSILLERQTRRNHSTLERFCCAKNVIKPKRVRFAPRAVEGDRNSSDVNPLILQVDEASRVRTLEVHGLFSLYRDGAARLGTLLHLPNEKSPSYTGTDILIRGGSMREKVPIDGSLAA
jgi:hypothetical protein